MTVPMIEINAIDIGDINVSVETPLIEVEVTGAPGPGGGGTGDGISQTDADIRYINTSGDAMSGFLTLNANPTSATHAATKAYVDLVAQGLSFKNSVNAATTTNITLSGSQTIDGVLVSTAQHRVLVKDQTTASQNGIYTVAAGAWTRATDADSSGEIGDGTLVPVEAGALNGDTLWLCTATSVDPWIPGTHTSTWTRFSSSAGVSAGNGLTQNASTINVVGDANLSVTADQVSVLSAPKWTTARTLTLTGGATGTVTLDGSSNVSMATTVTGGGGGALKYMTPLAAVASQTFTHGLGTADLVAEIRNTASPYQVIDASVYITSTSVTVDTSPAIGAGYRLTLVG
jgi:phage-related tail fiber protein